MKKSVKGFTLIELIIVIAIVGVLSALLIPTWINFITSSRLRTQNNNAKAVFNAAQTATTRYMFKERTLKTTEIGSGDFYFYWDGMNGVCLKADGTEVSPQNDEFNEAFATEINKVFSGSTEASYKVYIQNYKVKSVVSGRTENDQYKGSYPVRQDDIGTSASLKVFDMTTIDL